MKIDFDRYLILCRAFGLRAQRTAGPGTGNVDSSAEILAEVGVASTANLEDVLVGTTMRQVREQRDVGGRR